MKLAKVRELVSILIILLGLEQITRLTGNFFLKQVNKIIKNNFFRPIIQEVVEKIKSLGAKTLIVSFGADAAKGNFFHKLSYSLLTKSILSSDTYSLLGDPICTFNLVPENYFDIGVQLKSLNIPTLVIQEGGYSDNSVLGPVEEALLKGLM